MLLAGLPAHPDRSLRGGARSTARSAWQRFRGSPGRCSQPTLLVLGVVGTLLSFNVFDIIWLLTAGGPARGDADAAGPDLPDRLQGLPAERRGGHVGDRHAAPDGLRPRCHPRACAKGGGADEAPGPHGWSLAVAGLASWRWSCCLPFWWVVTGSIKLPREIIARMPTMFPQSFTLQHFQKLLQSSDFPDLPAEQRARVAPFSTVITVVLAVPAGYAFFRMNFRGRDALYRLILVAYAFPAIVVLIPLYGMFAQLGLVDSPDRAGDHQRRLRAAVLDLDDALVPRHRCRARSRRRRVDRRRATADHPASVIMVPLIAPGIASVAIFAFIVELDGISVCLGPDPYPTRSAPSRSGFAGHHRPVPDRLGPAARRRHRRNRPGRHALRLRRSLVCVRPDRRRGEIRSLHGRTVAQSRHEALRRDRGDHRRRSRPFVDGEFVVFVGPSGCGKSTLLRMIAGLETTSEGRIEIGGSDVTDLDPAKRGIAMVFQTYALYPHMTVAANMGFPLEMAGLPQSGDRRKVDDVGASCTWNPISNGSRASFRAASGSVWRSAGRSCASPRSSCSTSRYPILTQNCACRCGSRSRGCISN